MTPLMLGDRLVLRMTDEEYTRALYRLAAYWDMGQSVITAREVACSRLDW